MISNSRVRQRQWLDKVFIGLISIFVLITFLFILSVLWTLLSKGFAGLSLTLFTENLPTPFGQGGLANAIIGSLIMTGLAILISAPLGILIATYLVEYGKNSVFANTIRFFNDKLLSMPSIVIGLFIYAVIVRYMGGFSAFAGSIALAIIALPIIIRVSEDALTLVNQQVREAAVALGITHWRVIVWICYRSASMGMITGIILAFARIAGESAPLLFTALSNQFWSTDLTKPMASLPVTIYQYAMTPYPRWQELAWSGALLITFSVLLLTITAKLIEYRSEKKHEF